MSKNQHFLLFNFFKSPTLTWPHLGLQVPPWKDNGRTTAEPVTTVIQRFITHSGPGTARGVPGHESHRQRALGSMWRDTEQSGAGIYIQDWTVAVGLLN